MTWQYVECKLCGNSESIGIYYSEHMHKLSHFNIELVCGVCKEEEKDE
jgi:hypothetical protein